MKKKKIALMFCVVLLCGGTILFAQPESTEARPRIGILLDTKPLPDLLIKHLRLEPEQGIRISNIQEDSPADKAGLQRDDIIIGFEGQDVNSNIQLIDAVKKAGVGAEVSLEVIQLGTRNVIKLKLDSMEKEFDLKYPEEAEVFQSWRPGKIFRFKPGDKNWMEIDVPFDDKSLDVYNYYYSDGGEDCSITIEGNPEDKDTLITVRIGNDSYQTAVGEIDKLPEKFRVVAEDTLKKSKKHSDQKKKVISRRFSLPSMIKPDELSNYLKNMDELNKQLKEQTRFQSKSDPNVDEFLENLKEQLRFRRQPDLPKFEPDKRMFDKIEEQMRKLQERMDNLEKYLKEIPQRSAPESKKEQI